MLATAVSNQGCSSESKQQGLYKDHFKSISGYNGPLSQFNFSYARPVEFFTIGWIKVNKSELCFIKEKPLDLPVDKEASEKFYFYKSKVICPPRHHKFINWTVEYKGGRLWMAYDLDDEFLWFVDERKS